MEAQELYCLICEKFLPLDDNLEMVKDWSSGRGKAKVAVYRDIKTGLAHTFLSKAWSERKRNKRSPEEPPLITKEVTQPAKPVEVAAPAALEPQAQEWFPQEDEWFAATIVRVPGEYGFAKLSNDEEVFFRRRDMTPVEGGHRCFQVGDALAVRIKKSDFVGGKTKWRAIEVYNQTSHHADPVDATVLRWDPSGHWGFVRRTCGCELFVSVNEVAYLDPGDDVQVSKIIENKQNNARHSWMGRHVETVDEES